MVYASKTILFDTGGYNLRSVIINYIDKIDAVVISHLHFDHCSNLDLFALTDIPIYISKKEIDYYESNLSIDKDLFSYFTYIKSNLNIHLIDGDFCISEDLNILETPGHTPGHISLEVNCSMGKILIAGDSIKTFMDFCNPNFVGNAFDSNQYIITKKKLKAKYNIIFPGHDSLIKNGKLSPRMEVKEF